MLHHPLVRLRPDRNPTRLDKILLTGIILFLLSFPFLVLGMLISLPAPEDIPTRPLGRARLPDIEEVIPTVTPTKEEKDTPLVVTAKSRAPLTVLASLPYWDHERAVASFKRHVDLIDEISLFWYYLAADGSIQLYPDAFEDRQLLEFAKSREIRTFILIANLTEEEGEVWDPDRVDEVIRTSADRARHVSDLVGLAERLGVDGILIDYENLRENQTVPFTNFMRELADGLHAKGKLLRLATYPRLAGEQTYAQDLSALAGMADAFDFMTFLEHWDASAPGPPGSLAWIEETMNYSFANRVPKKKAILGIGLFGYDWPPDGAATGLEYDEVASLFEGKSAEPQFDEEKGASLFSYDGHTVWFEDAKSVEAKIRLAQELGMGGILFWRLGREDPAVWDVVRSFR